jgi:PAS domain S-box-containing protein
MKVGRMIRNVSRFFQKRTIRTQIIVVITYLLGGISLFIFLYFPTRLEKQAFNAISAKAKSISDMTAFSIAPALLFEDSKTIEEIFNSAKQNEDLVYIMVNDNEGREVAVFSKHKADRANFIQIKNRNQIFEVGSIYKIKTPIRWNNKEIGQLHLGLSLKDLKTEVARSRITSALVSLIIFAIGIVAAFLVSPLITRPLSHMVKTVEKIAQGDLKHRAPVSSQKEAEHLAKSFNLMVDNLVSAYEELGDINRSLEKRVEERTKELKREIDEHKRTEEALRGSEERFRDISENAMEWIWEVDASGKYTYSNSMIEKILGYKSEEVLGKCFYDFFHCEDREELTKAAFKGFTQKLTFREFINRNVHKNGEIVWLSTSGVPIIDGKGNLVGYRGADVDITRRKQAEDLLKKLNEELEQRVKDRTAELKHAYEQLEFAKEQFYQAQKMESIGILAGGIAHDFNNLLATIMGNISLAKMMTKPEDKIFNILNRAENVSLRAKDLTQQLLTFSRGGAPVKKIVSIAKIIKDSGNIATKGSKVSCGFSLPENIWPVEVDEGQLLQVFNNLIINADQAMPEGGTIKVRAENLKLDAGNGLQLPEGTYVKISIQDQGVGISEENLARIFDPFFTTKTKGTGLGLTTVYSIIKKHNGFIKVESKLGIGTTFQIYLPASHKEILVNRNITVLPEADLRCASSTGKILVMDDEENVRETVKEILTHLGFEAACAANGEETLNSYKKAKETGMPFDAVIMDLTIKGGMGGKEAIGELLKIDSEVKAIVSSGYSNDPIMADFKKYGFSGAVAKPYKVEELAKALNKVLQESDKKTSPSTIERF